MNKQEYTGARKAFKTAIKILSKVLLGLLVFVALFLLYIGISNKIYAAKGKGHEPKFSLYTIISNSMKPKLRVYDIIVDIRVDDPNTIKKGDIITFISDSSYSKDKTVTHRVTDIIKDENGKVQFKTQGDNNMSPDAAYVTTDNLLGKVVFYVPQLGRVQYFLANNWPLVVIGIALIYIIKDIFKLIRLSKLEDKASKAKSESNKDNKPIDKEAQRQESIKRKLDE